MDFKAHRERVKSYIRYINARTPPENKLSIKDVDSMEQFIRWASKEYPKGNKEHLAEPMSLAKMGIYCFGLMAFINSKEEASEQLFKTNWIDESGIPDPNFIFESTMIQISNYSFSIFNLIQLGLDNPARSLIRILTELFHQSLVLFSNPQDMLNYTVPDTSKESNEMWFKLFGKGKLTRKLEKLEDQLGFDKQLILELRETRKSNFEFYSQAVHNSCLATVVGSQAWSFEEDKSHLALFGGVNSAIKTPLDQLNYEIWYFLLMFTTILEKMHGAAPQDLKSQSWPEIWALYFSIKETYMEYYHS